jgi:hypothetical protein
MKDEKLSWKPERSGNIYCAPACGWGCKWKDYQRAKTRAEKLCKQLGNGFEPRVWENFGWHGSAVLGQIQVYLPSSTRDDYTAAYNSDCRGHGTTAKRALEDMLADFRERAEEASKRCSQIKKAMGKALTGEATTRG